MHATEHSSLSTRGKGRARDRRQGGIAASAEAHAGLVPEHLREAPRLGIAFILAFALLLAVVSALALCPEDRRIARVAALLLTGLIASWGASRVTGIPLLQPRPEAVDLVGLVTKLVEVLGLGQGRRHGDARTRESGLVHERQPDSDFLSAANPHNWPDATMRAMMKTHLDQTMNDAVDQVTGHYRAGIRVYDAIEQHIVDMADTLSSGIVKQFPSRCR
jgi:hypothetical protein